jgi:hypothetical protein
LAHQADSGAGIARRGFLIGAGVVGLTAVSDVLPRVAGTPGAGLPDLTVPANNLRALVRITASLDEQDVPWWYDGTIFGIVGEQAPRPLVRFEGMEIYWMRHLPGGDYELTGNTVTFFRDLETGAMIDAFENPYTGEVNAVTPAVQGGGPGRGFNYSVKGIRPTRFVELMEERPLIMDWSFARDMAWLHNQTVYPPGMPPPRAQRQTMFAPRDLFVDEQIRRLPTVFSSTVFMPWLKWMNMGERPGHVVWHASGVKLNTIDELPTEYRQRADKEFPEHLTADPATKPRPAVPPGTG